jgi:phage shock protein A
MSKVAELEKRIHALETRLAEITAELEKPETYQTNGAAASLSRESVTVSSTLEQLIAEGLLLSPDTIEG